MARTKDKGRRTFKGRTKNQGLRTKDQRLLYARTFVHGASSLELDGDYARVARGLDVRKMIADVTPKLLGVTPDKLAPSRGRKR